MRVCFSVSPCAVKSSEWVDRYRLKFLGSVQVPYHKGNDVLCAAMQKVEGLCDDRHVIPCVKHGVRELFSQNTLVEDM